MIIYSVSVTAASYRLNRSLIEGFCVKKFRTNYNSGWSVQEMEIVIADIANIKKAESIIIHSIKQYQAIKPTATLFVAQIKLRTQSLQMFPFLS